MNRNWALVYLAGLLEILWAIGLKHSDSFLSWGITLGLIYISFVVLIEATKRVPVATAYAVFTGIGTAGTVIVDIIVFGEAFSFLTIFFILLLLAGVLGLKLVTADSDGKEGEAR